MSPTPDPIDLKLIDRYLLGDCTPDETAAVERWIATRRENAYFLEMLRAEFGVTNEQAPPSDPRALWGRIAKGIDQMEREARAPASSGRMHLSRDPIPLRVVPRGRRPFAYPTIWTQGAMVNVARVAAVFAVAALSSLSYTHLRSATAVNTVASTSTAAPAMREVVTRRGQRAVLDLVDGSRVVLGAESRLRIPEGYTATGTRRDLYLEGEAYFEVAHDSTRSFRVHTSAGVAEDLGTAFVVSVYPETRGMQVVVASGVVALHQLASATSGAEDTARVDSRPLVTLVSGDLAWLDKSGTVRLTNSVDLAPYLAWTEGRLVFDGTRLRDVVPRLARWYDLEIQLADSALANRRLTATFGSESVWEVLDLIALSLDLQVERMGRSVTLSPKRGARRSS